MFTGNKIVILSIRAYKPILIQIENAKKFPTYE